MAENLSIKLNLTQIQKLPFTFSINGKQFAFVISDKISRRRYVKGNSHSLEEMIISNLPLTPLSLPRKIKLPEGKRLSVPNEKGEEVPLCVVRL